MIGKLYSLFKTYRNKNLEFEKIREIKLKKLKKIIKYSYENVPFYHNKWKEEDINPSDIKAIEDLKKIPLTRRKDLRKNKKSFISKKYYRHLDKLEKRQTSGISTGNPLKIPLDRKTKDFIESRYLLRLLEMGYDIRDSIGYYWYKPLKKRIWNKLGFLKKIRIPSKLNIKKQARLLKKYRPDYLYYFPSQLFQLSKIDREIGEDLKIKKIFTHGEILTESMRNSIQKSFNTEIYDRYATAEFGIVAHQCHNRNGYHINNDLILEISKNNCKEDFGKILITSLENWAMPLIRYETGDYGKLTDKPCDCKLDSKILESIGGRSLINVNGRQISEREIIDSIAKIENVRMFKIIRTDIKKFKILLKNKENELISQRIKENMKKLMGDVKLNINFVEKIERREMGKQIMFENCFE